jgi:hypothetical protein
VFLVMTVDLCIVSLFRLGIFYVVTYFLLSGLQGSANISEIYLTNNI